MHALLKCIITFHIANKGYLIVDSLVLNGEHCVIWLVTQTNPEPKYGRTRDTTLSTDNVFCTI